MGLLLILVLNAGQDLCWTAKTAFVAAGRPAGALVCDWLGNALTISALGLTVLQFSPQAVLAYATGGSLGAALGLWLAGRLEGRVGRPVPHPLRRRA